MVSSSINFVSNIRRRRNTDGILCLGWRALVRGHEHWAKWKVFLGRILNGENRSVTLVDILAGIKRDRNVSRELEKERKRNVVEKSCLTSIFYVLYCSIMFLYFQSKCEILWTDEMRRLDLTSLWIILKSEFEEDNLEIKESWGRFKMEEILFEMT